MLRLLCSVFLTTLVFASVKVGEPAPEIRLDALLPNQPVANATLPALAGRAVVLEFWATWCGPCVAAIPHLNALAQQFKDRPVVFLSITDEQQPVVEEFLKKRPISGWVGIASTSKLLPAYGVEGVPRMFLIDKAGKLAAALPSPEMLTAPMLEDLLAGRPITAPQMSFDFAVKRDDAAPGPPPLLDMIVRPSSAPNRGSTVGEGKLTLKGSTLRWILASACQIPETRIEGAPLADPTQYDLSFNLPGAGPEIFDPLVRELISAAFRIKVTRQTRNTDVYLLSIPSPRPATLAVPAGPVTAGCRFMIGIGKLDMNNCTLEQLARTMESLLGAPVLAQPSPNAGNVEVKVSYDRNAPGTLVEAVRQTGLKLEPARKPVDYLLVTK